MLWSGQKRGAAPGVYQARAFLAKLDSCPLDEARNCGQYFRVPARPARIAPAVKTTGNNLHGTSTYTAAGNCI